MTDVDAEDLLTPPPGEESKPRKGIRWKAVIGLAGLAGLVIATVSTVRDTGGQALPSLGAFLGAIVLQMSALWFAARAWATLFPQGTDRLALLSSLYTSQLTKYLPAGGFAQAASQVALSSSNGGMAVAVMRLPIFSLCALLGGVTFGSLLVFATDLAGWARGLAVLSLVSLVLLDRRILHALVRLARRFVRRLPPADDLPSQAAILRCYVWASANIVAFAGAFIVLLGDLADINPIVAGAALAGGWAAGYLVLFLPGGIGVREAFLVAALPGLSTGTVLAASVAHRLVGLVAEAVMASVTHLRLLHRKRSTATNPASSPTRPLRP